MAIRLDPRIIKYEGEDKQLERRQRNWRYEGKEPIAQTVTTPFKYVGNMFD